MEGTIDSGIDLLNALGRGFSAHAWGAMVQSSILIVVLLVLDLVLRKRVRAVVRCALWMLVFVKLLLPPTLSSPTGLGYYRPAPMAVVQNVVEPVETKTDQAGQPTLAAPMQPNSNTIEAPEAAVRSAQTPSPLAPVVHVPPAIVWQGWVFLAWGAGGLILCLCLVKRFRYVRRLVRGSVSAPGPLQEAVAQCADRIGLSHCPELRLSGTVPGPVVCGLIRPVVLMPATLAETLEEDRLQMVLTHELAHIKRGDLWINFVQTLSLVAYFYHPLLWLVNGIVRRLREQAVDETVLVALEAGAESYSTTLINLAEMAFERPIVGLRLIGIAESKKTLEGRIRHMMSRPKPKTAKVGLVGALGVVVLGAMLIPMAARGIETSAPGFKAALPTGVTVELVGICNWPGKDPVCWKPDGSSMTAPYLLKNSVAIDR